MHKRRSSPPRSTCLRSGDKYDSRSVFRLIALWFSLAHDEPTNAQLAAAVRETPSHKFLPLVYQIASRMSSSQTEEKTAFQTVLQDLVLKLTSEHPYHSLYQVSRADVIRLKTADSADLGVPQRRSYGVAGSTLLEITLLLRMMCYILKRTM